MCKEIPHYSYVFYVFYALLHTLTTPRHHLDTFWALSENFKIFEQFHLPTPFDPRNTLPQAPNEWESYDFLEDALPSLESLKSEDSEEMRQIQQPIGITNQ